MKKFYLIAAAAAIIITLLMLPNAVSGQNSNSQQFVPSRFAVIAAQINVFSKKMGGEHNTQFVMLKLDTFTGRTWLLQLDVAGGNDPKIRNSAWLELESSRK